MPLVGIELKMIVMFKKLKLKQCLEIIENG